MRLFDFFDRGAALWPDRDFLVDDARRFTYREAQQLTHRIAGAMHAGGFPPGGSCPRGSGARS